jgi:hypothetical protein
VCVCVCVSSYTALYFITLCGPEGTIPLELCSSRATEARGTRYRLHGFGRIAPVPPSFVAGLLLKTVRLVIILTLDYRAIE